MKIPFPSFKNTNKLTWKCKIFGCRNKKLQDIIGDEGERHGLKSFGGKYTATKTNRIYSLIGCRWCQNWKKVFEREEDIFKIWLCDCEKCNQDEK